MQPSHRISLCIVVLAGSIASATAVPAAPRPQVLGPPGALHTAVMDPPTFEDHGGTGFARTKSLGASAVRLILQWRDVAPPGSRKPRGFTAANPAARGYRWANIDRQIRLAVRNGLTPIVCIVVAPVWATAPGGGGLRSLSPVPGHLEDFARAAGIRYSGRFGGLPRVRYWQIWNEPNLTEYISPQFVAGRPFAPGLYRRMVNRAALALHAVARDNVVIAGGTSAFRDLHPDVMRHNRAWGPLSFMRAFLCLSKQLTPTCRERVEFDVWATQPYTSGGPKHHAVLPDDVSLGDLPDMRRTLQAGIRARHVVSKAPVRFWITEFSWDSDPPDPEGVPAELHTRWVAEGMYQMWRNGVSLVTWFLLRDWPLSTSYFQSGFYYRGSDVADDRVKPSAQAFKFPLVAFRSGSGIYVWGRTPAARPGPVVVEQSFNGGWQVVATLRANEHGIFARRFARRASGGSIRARTLRGEGAVPFSLTPVPDRFFNPFGLKIFCSVQKCPPLP